MNVLSKLLHYFSKKIPKTLILYQLQITRTFLQFFKSCRDTGTRFQKPGQSRKTATSGHPNIQEGESGLDTKLAVK